MGWPGKPTTGRLGSGKPGIDGRRGCAAGERTRRSQPRDDLVERHDHGARRRRRLAGRARGKAGRRGRRRRRDCGPVRRGAEGRGGRSRLVAGFGRERAHHGLPSPRSAPPPSDGSSSPTARTRWPSGPEFAPPARVLPSVPRARPVNSAHSPSCRHLRPKSNAAECPPTHGNSTPPVGRCPLESHGETRPWPARPGACQIGIPGSRSRPSRQTRRSDRPLSPPSSWHDFCH